ncbi:cytochrome P450 [bacterium]|nr:cytochrome P450 [bacterium]
MKSIPGPRGLEVLKTIFRFQRDPLTTLSDLTNRYGDIVRYRYGPFSVVLLNHPEAVQRMLQDNHPNYGKKNSPFYKMMRHFLGDGLVTSDGDFWRRQRRLAQPAFGRKRLEGLAPLMVQCTQDMLDQWRRLPPGHVLDAAQEMMKLTLRIVGLALFSLDVSAETRAVAHCLEVLQGQMTRRFQSLMPLPPVLPTPRDRLFRESRRKLEEIAMRIVRERRAQSNRPDDLLTALLEARDPETGEGMSDHQLCDELITFLLAGHETTANALAWTFYLLSLNPDQRRRLEAEVGLNQTPRAEDLSRLPLSERVVLESMRLYPPVWVYGRMSYAADEFMGYPIQKNQIVTVAPYVLHRNPTIWPNPEGFDPDRFLLDRPKGSYVPFAHGPRQCIGNHFAMMEARLLLVTVASQVRLNLQAGTRVGTEALVTLRPRGGLPMTLEWLLN